ncbi:alpha/beta hydrolase family esterase [Kribbella sp. WER1]
MKTLAALTALVTVTLLLPTANASVAGSPGCGRVAAPSGDYTIASGGLTRTYRLHVPDNYKPSKASPLIVVYHGRGKTGAQTEAFSGLDRLDAIVAYPNGVLGDEDKQAWQGAPYSAKGVDDVRFTSDLLDSLESSYCVDPHAVYATGKSNGAGFTGILACRLADRFAAIAPVSGAFYLEGTRCAPSRPVPVLDIHGTGDTTIPYGGDGQRGLPDVQTWVRDWSVRDHCKQDPKTSQLGDDVLTFTYKGCKADVVHVAVTDCGHTWPGSDSTSGPGYVTQTFQAADLIGAFFKEHKLS